MKIGLGADHGGYELKEEIKRFLEERGISVVDYGTHDTSSVDYPDYGQAVAKGILAGEADAGILCCGSGIGISISANRFHGIRAALCTDPYMAELSRRHNNSNVLALGGRLTGQDMALEIVRVWLETEFDGGRHQRRIDKLDQFEE